ncbi:MAG: InlB B-repeat-containing protein [Prevotellaceae bacterium]|nr:InlB B-repeat-containing protein [Prevotellaceae bacterium]
MQYYVDGTLKTTQVLKEFGTLNVKNEAYSVTTEDKTLNEDGFTTVTVKNVKSWNTRADGKGDTYNPKDLLVYNNTDRNGASVDFPLYAQWDENSGVQFNGIHDAYELTQFANVVNAGKEDANGILMADINMAESAWTSTEVARDGKAWGKWKYWVPIGATNNVYRWEDSQKRFRGIFDGNGYIVSNITMAEPIGEPGIYTRDTKNPEETQVTANWRVAYDRAGLIGFAEGATIKNVVVKNATLWGKWQVAAVCGRLGIVDSKGSITNCGSFGTLTLNTVGLKGVQGESDYAGDSRVVAGVVTTSTNTAVKSVWSNYPIYRNTAPAANANWVPSRNHVVGIWNNANGNTTNYNNTLYAGLKTGNESQWVYVDTSTDDGNTTDNSSWLKNGKLCLDLNGNLNGATTWTQTFVLDDNKNANGVIVDKGYFDNTNSYADCPRPTSRGLAVYKDAENVYSNHIYTVSFDANGGKENPADIYVTRVYGAENRTLSSESLPGAPTLEEGEIYVFNGWWTDPDVGSKVESLSVGAINSDMTLYAHWLAGPQTIEVPVNLDPTEKDYYYCTFYYSEQAYEILTSGALAYKAKREGEVASLRMESVKDANNNVSKIIPAGEAVILRVKEPDVDGKENKVIKLQAVKSEADIDPDNILYGSDEEVLVEEISDNIPDTSNGAAEDAARTNCYVFSGNATYGIGFYLPKAKYTSGANRNKYYLKAHMAFALLDGQIKINATASNDTQAKTLSMIFEDDEEQVTGISEHKSESETKKSIFSINGMPLSKLQKGINIVGGKKVFVK